VGVAIDFFVAVFARAILSNFVFFEEEATAIVVFEGEGAMAIVVCICHFLS